MAVFGTVCPIFVNPDLLKCPSHDEAFLGRGTFGSVLKAFMGVRHRTVAVKLIRGESNDFKNFKKEVTKLSAVLDCGNIITPLGWFTYAGWAGIVMEYAECGNLYQLLHTRGVNLPLCLKSRILYEIVNAVNHLHRLGNDQRLLHLDLKPHNILFDADLHVKICDLGGSVWSNLTENFTRSTEGLVDGDEQANVCSLAYCAPERLRTSNTRPTSKVDIFSIGVITWEVILQQKPYEGFTSRDELRGFILHGNRYPLTIELLHQHGIIGRFAQNAEKLIKYCWHESLTERPVATQIIKHFHQVFPFSQRDASAATIEILRQIPESRLTEENATASFIDVAGLNRIVPSYPRGRQSRREQEQLANQREISRLQAELRRQREETTGNVENSVHTYPPTSEYASTQSASQTHHNYGEVHSSGDLPDLFGAVGIDNNHTSSSDQTGLLSANQNSSLLGAVGTIANEVVKGSTIRQNFDLIGKPTIKYEPKPVESSTERIRPEEATALRCLMLGDKGVGKHVFKDNLGDFFPSGIIHVKDTRRELRVTFEENHHSPCDIVVYCYSSNMSRSLRNLRGKWIKKHQKYAGRNTGSAVILCLLHTRYDAILDDGQSLAKKHSLRHHEFPIRNEARSKQKPVYEAIFTFASSNICSSQC